MYNRQKQNSFAFFGEKNTCGCARWEKQSDKMIARGWNMLEIIVSPLENNRPCFATRITGVVDRLSAPLHIVRRT